MSNETAQQEQKKSARGFASMDKEQLRQIASSGGRAAHRLGKAHVFTHEEAVAAGKKGGNASSETYRRRRDERSRKLSR